MMHIELATTTTHSLLVLNGFFLVLEVALSFNSAFGVLFPSGCSGRPSRERTTTYHTLELEEPRTRSFMEPMHARRAN